MNLQSNLFVITLTYLCCRRMEHCLLKITGWRLMRHIDGINIAKGIGSCSIIYNCDFCRRVCCWQIGEYVTLYRLFCCCWCYCRVCVTHGADITLGNDVVAISHYVIRLRLFWHPSVTHWNGHAASVFANTTDQLLSPAAAANLRLTRQTVWERKLMKKSACCLASSSYRCQMSRVKGKGYSCG